MTPDPYSGEVTCLDVSCLPESKSPESREKLAIERRLLQKSEAAQRHLEELRMKRSKQEAQMMRDRPFVSKKSKELANNAEEKFWRAHFTPERKRAPDPIPLLEVQTLDSRPPRPPSAKLSKSRPLLPAPSYPSLRDRIQAFLTLENHRSPPPKPTPPPQDPPKRSQSVLKATGPKSTGRLRTGDVRVGRRQAEKQENSSFYRSISPACVNISFTEGCDFERLMR